MDNSVIMHCNYAEQGQTLDEMGALAARLGFDGVEFRRKRGGREETVENYLDEIARAVETHRLGQVQFGAPGPNLMTGDADSRRREVDEVAAFYRLASRRFDLKVCNIMTGTLVDEGEDYMRFEKQGSNIATEEQWGAAVEAFQELGDLASELDFKFAFETHNVYLHDLPEPTRKLIDLIGRDSVGANLDYGNILIHPHETSLEQSFEVLAGKVYMLHLKNMHLIPQRTHHHWVGCRLGEGVINNRQYLELAQAQGFDGPIVIEAPQPGDREWFAKIDLNYLREVMAEVG